MKLRTQAVLTLLLLGSLAACSAGSSNADPAKAPASTLTLTPTPPASEARMTDTSPAEQRLIGGQRDAHGCLTPAGYTWCEKEKTCVRPWELAAQKGFEISPESFNRYCQNLASTTGK